jgi:hypothetical protein
MDYSPTLNGAKTNNTKKMMVLFMLDLFQMCSCISGFLWMCHWIKQHMSITPKSYLHHLRNKREIKFIKRSIRFCVCLDVRACMNNTIIISRMELIMGECMLWCRQKNYHNLIVFNICGTLIYHARCLENIL